ncbi:hypothetical protein B0H14DRAFT_3603677 [Mycena olivaceomarginata]|nr:hypothetical protein B0H14DRAFT_3603677 [Mycena olivaceomarginata]
MPSVGGTNLLAATLRTPSIEVVDVQKNKRSEGLSPPFCPVTRSPNLPQQDLSPSSVLPSTVPGVVHFAPDHALPASLGPAVLSALDAWIGFLGHICVGKLACYLHAWHPPPLVLVWLVFHSLPGIDEAVKSTVTVSIDSGARSGGPRCQVVILVFYRSPPGGRRELNTSINIWQMISVGCGARWYGYGGICNIVVYLAAFACGRKQRRNPPGSTTPSARFFIPAPLLPEFEIGSEKTHRRQQNHEE